VVRQVHKFEQRGAGLTIIDAITQASQDSIEAIHSLHLGGSERAGIATFVNKLLPYRPAYLVEAALFAPSVPAGAGTEVRLAEEQDISLLAKIYRGSTIQWMF
jgi:hypothetical protein